MIITGHRKKPTCYLIPSCVDAVLDRMKWRSLELEGNHRTAVHQNVKP